jgi:glycosyltransferase involved in cell wall biosynthesis
VDAFAKVVTLFPQARLLLVGNGTCENSLREQSVKLCIDEKIRFVGYQDNVDAWLDLFDVFVLPSLAEYHSIALLEAMRAGKPIVSTNVGGNPESIEHEKQGLLVPPADAAALEKAILRMIDDPELRLRLGASAKKRFKDEFTEERMLEKIAAWLKRF